MKLLKLVGIFVSFVAILFILGRLYLGEPLLTLATLTKNPLFVKAALVITKPNDVAQGQLPALVVAAHSGHDVIVGMLLDAGANPNLRGPDKQTAIMRAVAVGNSFVARKLIAGGADLNLQDKEGRGALAYAAFLGRDGLAHDLLNNGADPDLQDYKGNPPIFESIVTGNHGITRTLVQKGANVNLVNHQGENPLLAAWKTWRQVQSISPNLERASIRYLLNHGQDILTRDKTELNLLEAWEGTEFARLVASE